MVFYGTPFNIKLCTLCLYSGFIFLLASLMRCPLLISVLLHYYLTQSANVLCFRAAEDSDSDAESIPPPPRSSFQMEADLRKISRQPQSTYRYLKVASAPLTVSTCVCFSSQRVINIAANQSRGLSEDLPELSGA